VKNSGMNFYCWNRFVVNVGHVERFNYYCMVRLKINGYDND
jgi:hypothetical protein